MNPCADVRESAEFVMKSAKFVSIDDEAIERMAAGVDDVAAIAAGAFDHSLHFFDPQRPELVAQYLLAVDALNFCFWPDAELEYEHLAGGLRDALVQDPTALDAARLATVDGPALRGLLGWPRPLPLEEERARLLREVGSVLLRLYCGQAAQLVRSAGGSAVELVRLVVAAFPGFRDHCVLGGRQLFFYKRAQIFVGDLHGCFGGRGLGAFNDIHQLTMFADYRVPVVLREHCVLCYVPPLAQAVDERQELEPGGRREVELRAATIVAVERLRGALQRRLAGGGGCAAAAAGVLSSVKLDWWLWEQGERDRRRHRPHHRTLTTYY